MMSFIARIRQSFLINKTDSSEEADAIVLSIMPGNKILLQVLPDKGRNFVTEINTFPGNTFRVYAGQRLRVKYNRAHASTVEIIEQYFS